MVFMLQRNIRQCLFLERFSLFGGKCILQCSKIREQRRRGESDAGSLAHRGKDGAWGRIRTTDTRIFNPLLYQLSYPGPGPLGATLSGGGSIEEPNQQVQTGPDGIIAAILPILPRHEAATRPPAQGSHRRRKASDAGRHPRIAWNRRVESRHPSACYRQGRVCS